MSEGAALDMLRVVKLVRTMISVPVNSDEAVIQKEMLATLRTISMIATAFKQYFEKSR